MEFVEGETLAQVLGKLKTAEPEADTPFGKMNQVGYFAAFATAFADVADGLQHAHPKGIIHRDIKPSNLILDGKGRLRILDFGLARLEGQESLTLSGDFVGTPNYMSPEQARRRKIPVDHRTDVYSLGATLYEAICGRPPFRGKDYADTLSQIIVFGQRVERADRRFHRGDPNSSGTTDLSDAIAIFGFPVPRRPARALVPRVGRHEQRRHDRHLGWYRRAELALHRRAGTCGTRAGARTLRARHGSAGIAGRPRLPRLPAVRMSFRLTHRSGEWLRRWVRCVTDDRGISPTISWGWGIRRPRKEAITNATEIS
jgi:serine/threonine protein kinase